jgi:Cu/Zn superoxide dismutase
VLRTARWCVLAISSLLLLAWSAAPAAADTTVKARLLATNHSGVRGSATLTAHNDGRLTVVIHARGLVPGQPHAQHLHGSLAKGHFMCPSMADDTDHDGLLTNEEAAGEYGNIFLALTTRGDGSARSSLAVDRMPVADSSGRLAYRRTFTADDLPHGLVEHLSTLHVVQHGIDVDGNGKYDVAGAGVSTFAKNLGVSGVPEEATDPASCGMVTGASAPVSPRGGPETGGSPPLGANGGVALLGGSLVAVAVVLLLTGLRMRRPGERRA